MPSELEQMFSEHAAAVRAVLRGLLRCSEDVEDCLQATWLVASTRLQHVVPGARRAWLIQVARNKALELLRRGGIAKQALEKLSEQVVSLTEPQEDPADKVMHQEQIRAVLSALDNLPAPQREVVRLKIYEGLTFQEIANELNIPLGTALTRMRLALQRLGDQLQGLGRKPDSET